MRLLPKFPRIGAPALPPRRPPGQRRPPRRKASVADGDLLGRLDAARERLRAEIPPRADDDVD